MPHRHLQRRETSPGDAEHAHVAIRPRLMRQPCNDLLAINVLLLGIFSLRWSAFAGAETADVHAYTHVSPPREISMLRIVSRSGAIVFSVRQVLQQGREFLSRLGAVRRVERSARRTPSFIGIQTFS